MIEPVSVVRGGYRFTYYARSGGMVVTRAKTGVVEDAGIIGNPHSDSITEGRLNDIAARWVLWRSEYLTLKKKNQPAEGRRTGHGRRG